jgi:hypothetical protein
MDVSPIIKKWNNQQEKGDYEKGERERVGADFMS